MTDVVRIVKEVIKNKPEWKEQLIAEGLVEERDGDIVILDDRVFEMIKWKEVDKR